MILNIEKLTIYVDSQDDAKAFWTEKMGFIAVNDQPMGSDVRWIEIEPQAAPDIPTIILYSKKLMMKQSPEIVAHPSIIFSAIDIEQLWGQLKNNGVEISDISETPIGKMFDFKDNEGNPYMVHG